MRRKKRHTVPFCLFFVYRELTRASVNWLGLAFPFLLLSLLPTLKSNRSPSRSVRHGRREHYGVLWLLFLGRAKGEGLESTLVAKNQALLCFASTLDGSKYGKEENTKECASLPLVL